MPNESNTPNNPAPVPVPASGGKRPSIYPRIPASRPPAPSVDAAIAPPLPAILAETPDNATGEEWPIDPCPPPQAVPERNSAHQLRERLARSMVAPQVFHDLKAALEKDSAENSPEAIKPPPPIVLALLENQAHEFIMSVVEAHREAQIIGTQLLHAKANYSR